MRQSAPAHVKVLVASSYAQLYASGHDFLNNSEYNVGLQLFGEEYSPIQQNIWFSNLSHGLLHPTTTSPWEFDVTLNSHGHTPFKSTSHPVELQLPPITPCGTTSNGRLNLLEHFNNNLHSQGDYYKMRKSSLQMSRRSTSVWITNRLTPNHLLTNDAAALQDKQTIPLVNSGRHGISLLVIRTLEVLRLIGIQLFLLQNHTVHSG